MVMMVWLNWVIDARVLKINIKSCQDWRWFRDTESSLLNIAYAWNFL